jgi:hypothetical protein
MLTVRVMMRYYCARKSIELAIEQYVALALQELFGSVFVGAVTVTHPLPGPACITIFPVIICVIVHCPNEHNELLVDSPKGTVLFIEECISLALEKRLDHVLLDMVTVSHYPHEDRQYVDIHEW